MLRVVRSRGVAGAGVVVETTRTPQRAAVLQRQRQLFLDYVCIVLENQSCMYVYQDHHIDQELNGHQEFFHIYLLQRRLIELQKKKKFFIYLISLIFYRVLLVDTKMLLHEEVSIRQHLED